MYAKAVVQASLSVDVVYLRALQICHSKSENLDKGRVQTYIDTCVDRVMKARKQSKRRKK